MTISGEEAIKKAHEEIPHKFYETSHKVHLVIAVGLGYFLSYLIGSDVDVAMRAAGGASFLVSALADRISTIKAFNAMNKMEDLGMVPLSSEANFLLGNVHTAEEFQNSPRVLAIDSVAMALSVYSPGFGIAAGVAKIQAAMNNTRSARRMERAAEIFQEGNNTGTNIELDDDEPYTLM